MTVIVIALLAAAGLVVLAASAWRWAAARRQDLLTAGRRVADRPHMPWLPGTRQTPIARVRYVLRPGWLFGTSVVLGLLVIASAAAGAGILVRDVTAGDGIAVLDHPVAATLVSGRQASRLVGWNHDGNGQHSRPAGPAGD